MIIVLIVMRLVSLQYLNLFRVTWLPTAMLVVGTIH